MKKNEYPIVPAIQFKSYGVVSDVHGKDSIGYLTISYTDGDGDIGMSSNQSSGFDFFLTMFKNKNGHLVEVTLPDTSTTFNARLPILTPAGSNKNIRGDITMAIELTFARNYILSDTIAFDVSITDQAQHKSNVVRTPILPYKY